MTAALDVYQCKNLDGSISQYFTEAQVSGCGSSNQDAENAARKVWEYSGQGCLGDQAGCCQYHPQFTQGVCTCTLAAETHQRRQPHWAAFASDGHGRWGYAIRQANLSAAHDVALKGCVGTGMAGGCKVFGVSTDSCVAFAEGREDGYRFGAGSGRNEAAAGERALEFCKRGAAKPASCRVAGSWCQ